MLATERKQLILDELNQHGRIVTSELAARLHVSDVTIRTDLDELERRGRLSRTHGGAVIAGEGTNSHIIGFDTRMAMDRDAKRRIALAAAAYVHSDQTIIIDAGTTTHHLAQVMPAVTDLTVFTPGITIAQQLLTREGIETHLMGGRVDPQWLETVGTAREQGIDELLVHTLFLGAFAIDPDLDIVDPARSLARNKIQFARRSRTTVLLADATKWQRHSANKVLPVANVDVVITDSAIDQDVLRRLRALPCEIVLA